MSPIAINEVSQVEPKKKISLNFFTNAGLSHMSPGQWKDPKDTGVTADKMEYWINLAKLAERGKIAFIFIADSYGGHDVYKGSLDTSLRAASAFPVLDPFTVIPIMASVTKTLGFGVTASTSYENPFALARRLSSLDHLTDGRIAWNIVTSWSLNTAKALGKESVVPHDERYAMAEEYMEIVYQLWESSWADDAIVNDVKNNTYIDPAKVKTIEHDGKYFKMTSRAQVHPSPQRTPLLFQAGTSSSGKAFASRHAEAIYIGGLEPKQSAGAVKAIRDAAAALNRDPRSVKFFVGMSPVLGRTEEEAKAKLEHHKKFADPEAGLAQFCGYTGMDLSKFPLDEPFALENNPGHNAIHSILETFAKASGEGSGASWTPRMLGEKMSLGGLHPSPVGTPSQVADVMEQWIRECDVDGFNLSYTVMPGSFEDIVDLLRPELLKRGLVDDDYAVPGGSIRENFYGKGSGPLLRADHPANKFVKARADL